MTDRYTDAEMEEDKRIAGEADAWGDDYDDYDDYVTSGYCSDHIARFDPPRILRMLAEIERLRASLDEAQDDTHPSDVVVGVCYMCGRDVTGRNGYNWKGGEKYRCMRCGLKLAEGRDE